MSTTNNAATPGVRPGMASVTPMVVLQRVPANLLRWIVVLAGRPRARPPRWDIGAFGAIAAVIAVVIISMFFFDAAAITGARHLPRWIHDTADEITNLGRSGVFLYPLGFLLLVLAAVMGSGLSRMANGVLAALAVRFGFLFVAIGLPSLFVTIVKRLIGRARPYVGGHDDPFNFMPFIWRPEYSSMPSGHAATAAAAAIAIGALWPRLRPAMWVYVVVIMASRILIFVHHPSDVIAAVLVGVIGAELVRRWFAARRLGFCPSDLHAYPWPSWRRFTATLREIVGGARLSAS
jgi:membrane-associated phospholipid phosphatase